MEDGRRSFPSGHSSLAIAVYLYLALFLYRKLCQIKNSGSLRVTLPIGLNMFAFAVMVSRTSDYRHFPTDVLIGGAIGTFISLVSWLFYDRVMHDVYADYCREHGLTEGAYIRDPLSLSTPAQFVPKSLPKSLPKDQQAPLREPSLEHIQMA